MKKVLCIFWLVICGALFPLFAQSTPYVITQFPIIAVSSDSLVVVQWTGINRTGVLSPDSGDIYFSRSPGGSNLKNYPYKIIPAKAGNITFAYNKPTPTVLNPTYREIDFKPSDQPDMGAGVYYCIVARTFKVPNIQNPLTLKDTVLFSNELPLIVESKNATVLTGPAASDSNLTPTFTWNVNPGVPYYHLILSDEEIKVDTTGGGIGGVSGLSIIWQAITANTQIVYGAPDPSGTITASPPPLSPGKTYSVVVLNNYGNHPAYTSTKVGFPKMFTIVGKALKKPIPLTPNRDTLTNADSIVRFKWRNLDPNANTYKVYINIGSTVAGIGASLVVWDNEVTAGSFTTDTGYIDINVRQTLTSNHYTWKAIAVDSKGGGSSGDTVGFTYHAPQGTISLKTREHIMANGTTLSNAVSAVEIKVEVLDGSLEKPLLFYTDMNGVLERQRPVGTYRLTAHKSGFVDLVKTITIADNQICSDSLILERPAATIFGKIVDEAGSGIDLATVKAVSGTGDTVFASTDRFGSYLLSCSGADWSITVRKPGFVTSLSIDTVTVFGQSVEMKPILLVKVPFSISGTIKNRAGQAIIGVRVVLIQGSNVIGEVPSTSQTGAFSFSASAGSYTLTATKTGFTSVTKTIDLSASQQLVVTMDAGAAMVTGSIIGKNWNRTVFVKAPVIGAQIYFKKLNATGADTIPLSATTDATYGTYRISLPGNDSFSVWSDAQGYSPDNRISTLKTLAGVTSSFNDSLNGLALIRGWVFYANQSNQPVALAGAQVVLVDTGSGAIRQSVTTAADGLFEMRNIPDVPVVVKAGKNSWVVKIISPEDTLEIVNGHENRGYDSIGIEMKLGLQRIVWSVTTPGLPASVSTIKLQSPYVKSMSPDSVLTGVGSGEYVVAVNAADRRLIDLSYHRFTVNTETVHTEPLVLPVTFNQPDSLCGGLIDSASLTVTSTIPCDSAILYYKDITGSTYLTSTLRTASDTFAFKVLPSRDASYLVYYFKVFKGADVYGYSQESYRTFIRPSLKLTKLQIVPSSSDTLIVPANYTMTFILKAFYSSTYLPDTTLDTAKWSIIDSQGCVLIPHGTLVDIATPLAGTARFVTLVAKVPTALVKAGYPDSAIVRFKVSTQQAKTVRITRVDPLAADPLVASPGNHAEFVAEAIDSLKNAMTVMPDWSVMPKSAGVITPEGSFTPSTNFTGFVRVFAQVTDSGKTEYNVNAVNPLASGLAVRHAVTAKPIADTLTNGVGMQLVLPDSIVGTGETGLFSVSLPSLDNRILRGIGKYNILGNAVEIKEVNGVRLRLNGSRTMALTLEVPPDYQGTAASTARRFSIAYWQPDSLDWVPVPNSTVAANGKSITVGLSHLSMYAVVQTAGDLDGLLNIVPNPFSPMKTDPLRLMQVLSKAGLPAFPAGANGGTWITFNAQSPSMTGARLFVYTQLGDLVFSTTFTNIKRNEDYKVFWDGTSSRSDLNAARYVVNEQQNIYYPKGDRLCRNGRYIVVLTVTDVNNKEKNIKRQCILVK